jgi:hypothetical protein
MTWTVGPDTSDTLGHYLQTLCLFNALRRVLKQDIERTCPDMLSDAFGHDPDTFGHETLTR